MCACVLIMYKVHCSDSARMVSIRQLRFAGVDEDSPTPLAQLNHCKSYKN